MPIKHFRTDRRVEAIMIEIRRDTYMVEPAGPPTSGLEAASRALRKAFGRNGSSGDH